MHDSTPKPPFTHHAATRHRGDATPRFGYDTDTDTTLPHFGVHPPSNEAHVTTPTPPPAINTKSPMRLAECITPPPQHAADAQQATDLDALVDAHIKPHLPTIQLTTDLRTVNFPSPTLHTTRHDEATPTNAPNAPHTTMHFYMSAAKHDDCMAWAITVYVQTHNTPPIAANFLDHHTMQRHAISAHTLQTLLAIATAYALATLLHIHRPHDAVIHTSTPITLTANANASLTTAGKLPSSLITLTHILRRLMPLSYITIDHQQCQHRLAKACKRAAARKALTTPYPPFFDAWTTTRLDNWAIAALTPDAYPHTILHITCNAPPLTRPADDADPHHHRARGAQHTTDAYHPNDSTPSCHKNTTTDESPSTPATPHAQHTINVVTYNARTLADATADRNHAKTTAPYIIIDKWLKQNNISVAAIQ